MHVILVTARDGSIDPDTSSRWSRTLPGSSVALLGALPRAAYAPPFEPLLAAQPFDEVTLPASGRGTSCTDLGLTLVREGRDARGREREVCSVPGVPPDDITRVPGFFYDDFSADLADTCGARPYRIAFTPALDRPAGASVEMWCEEGTAACGLDVVSARLDPRDAGRD